MSKPKRRPFACVRTQGFQQPRREHHVSILVALALVDAQHHALAVDVGDPQMRGLRHAQARGVGGGEDRAVLQDGDGLEEACHLVAAQDDRQPERLLGHRDVLQCPVALERDLVEKPQRRSRDADARGRELARFDQMDLVRAHVLGPERFGRATEVARVGADLLEVRKLGVLGEIANAHVFEHALAKGSHDKAPDWKGMTGCEQPPNPSPTRASCECPGFDPAARGSPPTAPAV
jgi:hypothetical protein